MSGQHRQALPEECASCRKVFAVVVKHHQESPDLRLTVTEIGVRCGLKREPAQRHLSHLVKHKRIKADGRTPVKGATVKRGGDVPDDATPLQWAANIAAPDRACGKFLRVFAAQGWSGRISSDDIALAGGTSLRTWKGHRPHLVTARLVEFRSETVMARDGRSRVRLADRYRLMTGAVVAAPMGKDYEGDMAHDHAKTLVDSIHWYCASPADMVRAYRLVAARLLAGWPADELLRRALFPEPDAHVGNPYGLLATRMPDKGEPYVIPAELAVRGPGRARCTGPDCGRPFSDGVGPADGLCRDCREERAAQLPMAPVERVELRHCPECSKAVSPTQFLCDGCGADQRIPA